MLKLVRSFTPPVVQRTGPCDVCYDLDADLLWKSQRANRRGPFRLGFSLKSLKEAVDNRCPCCTIFLRGLEFLGGVKYISGGGYQDLVFRLHIAKNAPLRFKVFRPGDPNVIGEYDFFTATHCEPAFFAFGRGDDISRDPLSVETIQLIKYWTDDCIKNHARCQSSDLNILPYRVINVGSKDTTRPRLEETYGDKKGTYVALSHCWGAFQPLITTQATLERRKSGIEWSLLPKTFQDAVQLTRALGMEYLWIDSLCIVQDNEGNTQTHESLKLWEANCLGRGLGRASGTHG
jgi:Heterokaryon incompatibility protein (HET)